MENSQPSPSRNLVDAVNSTTYIPLDLTVEILSKLPANSLIRFQSVSKLWFSVIRSKYFTDSFLTRSRTRPRLLLTFKDYDSENYLIFSAPEHQNNDKSFSTVISRHTMTISDLVYYIKSRPVNGLICCTRGSSIAICNPSTRQIVKLPDVKPNGRHVYARLGYDPVQDQYKVLCVMMFGSFEYSEKDIQQEHFVCTVRPGEQEEWRKIEIEQDPYMFFEGGICIDGAIYYGVCPTNIARFDVRSEKIEIIQGPEQYDVLLYDSTLINYQGKLAVVSYDYDCESEMSMWILQDVEKQEWSSIHTNEVMIISRSVESSKLFCVYYCDLIRECIRRIEVEGFRVCIQGLYGKRDHKMLCFAGHIENIMFF